MTLLDYTAYFEALATKFKNIGHSQQRHRFARIDIEEVILGLRSRLELNEPCLILEAFEGTIDENQGDNNLNAMTGAFYIMQNAREGDTADEAQVLSRSLEYGKQVVARINQDAAKRRPTGFLKNFRLQGVTYHKVGPIWDNAYGYRFQFPWVDSYSTVVQDELWTD